MPKIKSKRVSLRFCNTASKVISKTVIIIIPINKGELVLEEMAVLVVPKENAFQQVGVNLFWMEWWNDCYDWIVIFRKLSWRSSLESWRRRSRKGYNIPIASFACMVTGQYLNLFKVMDLHWEGEGNPLVAAFRTNCIQGRNTQNFNPLSKTIFEFVSLCL